MATAAVNAAVWVVGKALAPFTGDLLETWGASKELGTNIKELKLELLLVKVMLENARHKQLDGSALEELLQNLRDLASDAEDVLDELEYFRIQDKLYNTSDAVDKHAKGCAHNIVLNARHTAKAIGKLLPCSSAPSPGNPGEEDAGQRVLCCAWLRARQRIRGNSSSAPNTDQLDEEVSGCMGKLGQLLPCSSFQPWTPTLCSVEMRDARCPEKLNYSKFSSLELKHLQMLTSLKDLSVNGCKIVFGTLDDVELQLPIEHLRIWTCDANGKELTQLLSHLPKLSELTIRDSNKKTRLGVVAEKQHTTTPVPLPSSSAVEMEDTKATDQCQQIAGEAEEEEVVAVELVTEQEKEEDGLLLFPTHLSNSLQELSIFQCRKLSLIAPPTLPNGHKTGVGLGGEAGGIQALRSLQKLEIHDCPKLLSAYQTSFSASCCPFPSSLKDLFLRRVEGMETLEPLSNLTSLTRLEIVYCGEDLICVGLWPLLTQGQLSKLIVHGCPKFFVGWDPMQGLQDEQELLPLAPSSKLLGLDTDDATGFLAAPIYSLLSSSLTKLAFSFDKVVERFTEEQEEALQLLTSLQELQFRYCLKLQSLPAGLNKLTNLKRLTILECRAIRSLPEDGLPSSLQELDVRRCGNEELKQKCRLSRGTIPKIILD